MKASYEIISAIQRWQGGGVFDNLDTFEMMSKKIVCSKASVIFLLLKIHKSQFTGVGVLQHVSHYTVVMMAIMPWLHCQAHDYSA